MWRVSAWILCAAAVRKEKEGRKKKEKQLHERSRVTAGHLGNSPVHDRGPYPGVEGGKRGKPGPARASPFPALSQREGIGKKDKGRLLSAALQRPSLLLLSPVSFRAMGKEKKEKSPSFMTHLASSSRPCRRHSAGQQGERRKKEQSLAEAVFCPPAPDMDKTGEK